VTVDTVRNWREDGLVTWMHGRTEVTNLAALETFFLAGGHKRPPDRSSSRPSPRPPPASLAARFGATSALVVAAVLVGGQVEEAWTVAWHPAGYDVDSVAGIVVALLLLLAGVRLLDRLLPVVCETLRRRRDGRRPGPVELHALAVTVQACLVVALLITSELV